MEELGFYFKEGWRHIVGMDALDHQLFILAMCAAYVVKDWRRLLILVTAFTLGHSLTLALSTFEIIHISSAWVEFLIPCTIVLTAAWSISQLNVDHPKIGFNYVMAFLFGLIHGLGFANTIRMMLASDQNFSISLLGFNLGLEVGQIVVVGLYLLLAMLFLQTFKLPRKYWIAGISIIVMVLALKFAFDRFPV